MSDEVEQAVTELEEFVAEFEEAVAQFSGALGESAWRHASQYVMFIEALLHSIQDGFAEATEGQVSRLRVGQDSLRAAIALGK